MLLCFHPNGLGVKAELINDISYNLLVINDNSLCLRLITGWGRTLEMDTVLF